MRQGESHLEVTQRGKSHTIENRRYHGPRDGESADKKHGATAVQYLSKSAAFERSFFITFMPTLMIMAQQSLVKSAKELRRSFAAVRGRFVDKEFQQRSGVPGFAFRIECNRYKEWAAIFGAFGPLAHTPSLDDRVQDHPKIAIQIKKHIGQLDHALNMLVAIGSGKQPNHTSGTNKLETNKLEEGSGDDSKEELKKSRIDLTTMQTPATLTQMRTSQHMGSSRLVSIS
jgi:hypothetical protein